MFVGKELKRGEGSLNFISSVKDMIGAMLFKVRKERK